MNSHNSGAAMLKRHSWTADNNLIEFAHEPTALPVRFPRYNCSPVSTPASQRPRPPVRLLHRRPGHRATARPASVAGVTEACPPGAQLQAAPDFSAMHPGPLRARSVSSLRYWRGGPGTRVSRRNAVPLEWPRIGPSSLEVPVRRHRRARHGRALFERR